MHIPAQTGLSAHSPHPQAFPLQLQVIPLPPWVGRVGGWRHRRRLGGSEWYLLTNTKGSSEKKVALLCTCPFVLSNQWGLWSLYGPDSVFSGLIYWSSMPGAHGSASKSHACTDRLGMSCGKAFTEDIRCLLST